MKCLTVAQPWAWLILHGYKLIENRTWRTPHRGPLVIHAGRRRDMLDQCYADPGLARLLPDRCELPFSAIVGTVTLEDCVRTDSLFLDQSQQRFIDGPWCWILSNAIALERPIAYSGQRLLFDIPDSVIDLQTA